jgi:hypothetical protein
LTRYNVFLSIKPTKQPYFLIQNEKGGDFITL